MTNFGSEYRCPVCLKNGLSGLNLAHFMPGVPMANGLPVFEVTLPLWVVCLTCYADERPGLGGRRGVVLTVDEFGTVEKIITP